MSLKYIVFVIIAINMVKCKNEVYQATLANIPEDGLLNFSELAMKYGHPAKEYDITTRDGHILKLYHLPGNKGIPIVLSHGVFDSSDGWILRGNKSLAIILAKKGYDVWLINYRGNRYSRAHNTLDPDKNATYWEYSAHELALYDLPACIDHVLNVTGQKQLILIGFSEGTTAFFILSATQPDYNKKVKIFIALAPIVYLQNVRSGLSVVIQISPFLNFILPASIVEVTGYYSLMKAILNLLCTQLVIGYELCYQGGMNYVSGSDTNGIEREFFPIVMGHFPSGTSRKNLMHFAQISQNKKFAPYDYGPTKNLNMYFSFTPPAYDISKVTVPTVLVSAKKDPVSTLEDVEILKKQLSNVVKHIVIEKDSYNHLDHLWAKDASEIEYPHILNIVAEYT